MKKLYFLSMFTLAIMVAVLPQHTKAQNPWDGSYAPWTHGSGTQADPYLIEEPCHLAWLAHQVNDSAYTYNGKHFRLTNNLNMGGLNWTPIGNSTTNRFMGNFDGNGHFIDNINIISFYEGNSGIVNYYSGLFGVIDNAIIMDLGVNTTITAIATAFPKYAGCIVAYIYGSTNTLMNCYNTGSISFEDNLSLPHAYGGIVGYINGETTLNNCKNYGQIYDNTIYTDGLSFVGGLIGKVNAAVTMSGCSNHGTVESYCNDYINYIAGGLIGFIQSGTTSIVNSHNDGYVQTNHCGGLVGETSGTLNISNCYNTGILSGRNEGNYDYIGGLAGKSGGPCSIENSYNIGNLTNAGHMGGLVGYSANNITITNSYNGGSLNNYRYGGGIVGNCQGLGTFVLCSNSGNVNVNTSYDVYGGGIIGYANYQVTLDRCYNTAAVSGIGTSTNTSRYVGGLVGYLTASANNIHECYNAGAVSTGANATYNKCGGILGYNNGVTSITNCYNVGTLSGGSPKGIVDYNSNTSAITTISNCYYLNTCGGSSQVGGQAASVTLMKSPSFPYMLNNGVNAFTVDGNPNVNQGYPIFGDMVYAVSTQNATNVGVTRATLNGNYVGGADTVGFQYRENTTGSAWNTVYASIGSPVSYQLTGLQSNTNYLFRFMVLKNGGVYYGEEKTFTTGTCNLTASVSSLLVTLCQGEMATITASGQSSMGNQFSFSWNTGETTSTISVISGGERVVTVSDSNGCTATASVNVTVHPLPNVAISGNTTLCAGASNTLTASGGNSYLWNTGITTPSITVNSGGTYSVTATNSYGCSSSASVSVTSIENVTISGNLNLCQGQSTTLYANGTGTYQWSTGASTPSITVQQAGPYSVTVSGGGCTSSAFVTVNVAANPTPTILGNTVICQNQSTTLTANGGVSYFWNNGSTNNNISVNQSGTYTVTATNTEGCSATASTYVTVNPLPNVSISGNTTICQGSSTTTLTASGANTYAWSNNQSQSSITVSNPGTYTVTGTDVNGCTNTASQTVAVNPTYNIPLTHSICEGENYNFYGQNLTSAGTYTHTLQTINGCDSVLTLTLTVKSLPTAAISGNTSICEGQSTTLTAVGGNSYSWNTGSINSSISVNQSGIYTVTATNAEGCSASTSTTVTVNPLPTITIGGNTTICQGSSTTLTASGADSYSWSTGENTASVNISSFGVYTVTGTSAEGCSNTADVTVLVSQLPVITITGETDFCAGESTTLTANGGETYMWNDGTTDAEFTVNMAGTYQVIGYNAAGCYSMESVTVNQWQPASSEFAITTNEDCYEWNGQSYCQTGDYTQTFQTIHGCDSVVTLHLTIETGIDNYAMNANMNIYPNPTSDVINVQLTMNNEQTGNVAIQVFDVYGKMLEASNVVNTHGTSLQTRIDLSRYANGVYFIKVVSEGNVLAVRKVVKNR